MLLHDIARIIIIKPPSNKDIWGYSIKSLSNYRPSGISLPWYSIDVSLRRSCQKTQVCSIIHLESTLPSTFTGIPCFSSSVLKWILLSPSHSKTMQDEVSHSIKLLHSKSWCFIFSPAVCCTQCPTLLPLNIPHLCTM